MIFDGQDNPQDGTIVVVGNNGAHFGKDKVLFCNVKLAEDAAMIITDQGGIFSLYDFYGNVIPTKNGKITIPLDDRGFFLRAYGTDRSFASLIEAFNSFYIRGIEPLEIVAHDLLQRIKDKPNLHLSLTNVLNRPIRGDLVIELGDLQMEAPREIQLQAHDTRELCLKVTLGKAIANNTYPLKVIFTGPDGKACHNEDLHVNIIARRQIKIDGSLEDWQGGLWKRR